jgi:hypothetical protein
MVERWTLIQKLAEDPNSGLHCPDSKNGKWETGKRGRKGGRAPKRTTSRIHSSLPRYPLPLFPIFLLIVPRHEAAPQMHLFLFE